MRENKERWTKDSIRYATYDEKFGGYIASKKYP